jgi:hypothetical protein
MHWPGLQPGSSKQYAMSGKIERRLRRLLQALAQGWGDLELNEHHEAEYDENQTQLAIQAKGTKRRDPRSLTAYLWIEADEDDEETYLMAGWYAKRKRPAKELAKEVSKQKELRLPGLRVPDVDERQWYVRSFPLSQIEGLQSEEQMERVTVFVRETFKAIEQSGILNSLSDEKR